MMMMPPVLHVLFSVSSNRLLYTSSSQQYIVRGSPRHAIVRYVQEDDINELKMYVVGCESRTVRSIHRDGSTWHVAMHQNPTTVEEEGTLRSNYD